MTHHDLIGDPATSSPPFAADAPHPFQPGGQDDEFDRHSCAWCGEHSDEGIHDVPRICPACGVLEAASGDRYCAGCASAEDRSAWVDSADPFQRDSTGQAVGFLEDDPMGWEF